MMCLVLIIAACIAQGSAQQMWDTTPPPSSVVINLGSLQAEYVANPNYPTNCQPGASIPTLIPGHQGTPPIVVPCQPPQPPIT